MWSDSARRKQRYETKIGSGRGGWRRIQICEILGRCQVAKAKVGEKAQYFIANTWQLMVRWKEYQHGMRLVVGGGLEYDREEVPQYAIHGAMLEEVQV